MERDRDSLRERKSVVLLGENVLLKVGNERGDDDHRCCRRRAIPERMSVDDVDVTAAAVVVAAVVAVVIGRVTDAVRSVVSGMLTDVDVAVTEVELVTPV